jgi:hypothetical protein
MSDASNAASDGSLIGRFDDYTPTQAGFGRPFIDVDEWHDEPRRHRLLHGGFEGTETLFTFYFPPAAQYQGRLLQYLEGGAGGHENILAANVMGFGGAEPPWQYAYAFDEMGALLIESNQGHPSNAGHTGFHNDVYLFGASAETARFAKWLALRLFGSDVERSYVFGASGGGHRSFQCLMRAPDVYDGAVPEVFGVNPGAYWSIFGDAVDALGADVVAVRDAMEPGGSGDPFNGLSFHQREVLRDLFQMGFPRGATTQLAHIAVFPFTLYNTIEHNPKYFHDFWNTKGYLGHDEPGRLGERLIQTTATVDKVVEASDMMSSVFVAMQLATAGATLQTPYGVRLNVDDPHRLVMAKVTVKSGKAAGREMVIADVAQGDALVPFGEKCPELFEDVEPGDEVEIDNRDWIAFCNLYRHSVEFNVPGLRRNDAPVPDDYERFAVDGHAVFPQTGASHYDLDVVDPWPGKMIYIGAVNDICIWPTIVSSFDQYVRSVIGDRTGDTYRLWWVENSTHGRAEMASVLTREPPSIWRTRLVDYEAVGATALTALRAWVEDGVEPPADSAYTLTADKDIVLSRDPLTRGGVQPVVELTVGGGARIDVQVGQEVTFDGRAIVPKDAGTIVEAEMDFDGSDTWPLQVAGADGSRDRIDVNATHVFTAPGTYFPVLRVGSHRDGAARRGEAVRNLARCRVVVSAPS